MRCLLMVSEFEAKYQEISKKKKINSKLSNKKFKKRVPENCRCRILKKYVKGLGLLFS